MTWAALTVRDRRIVQSFLTHDPHGRQITTAARGDTVYAWWLFRVSQAFADRTGVYPTGIGDDTWKDSYRLGFTPLVAVKVDLHERPLVRIVGDHLVCPVCASRDSIVEEDESVRGNELTVEDGFIFGTLADIDHQHRRFGCTQCDCTVQLPGPVEDFT